MLVKIAKTPCEEGIKFKAVLLKFDEKALIPDLNKIFRCMLLIKKYFFSY